MQKTTVQAGGKAEIQRLLAMAKEFGMPDGYSAKRKKPRVKGSLYLDLSFDPSGSDPPVPVTTNDLSETGVGFRSKQPISGHPTVYLRDSDDSSPRPWLKARVVHCTPVIQGFLIGCEFELGN